VKRYGGFAEVSQDKQLSKIIYPGGYHRPFIDINREEVFIDLAI
jgi:hypothetical protein